MKKTVYTMALIALAGSTLLAAAAENSEEQRPKFGNAGKHMLKRFDTDGDGKLSDSEKEAMKAFMAERKARADTDGDGKISDAEREAAREKMKERMKEHAKEQGKDECSGECDAE